VSTPSRKACVESEAELLVSFVNSVDLEEGVDSIATPEALAAWQGEHLGEAGAGPVPPDRHAGLLGLRESLRALLLANNGVGIAAADLRALRAAAEGSRFRPTVSGDGLVALAPEGDAAARLEARLLLAVERLQAAGAWPRLKACTADDCRWAFFDTTRNRSRTWCSMDVCGNREKTRRYRGRHSAGAGD
jgi:predicted RNA-binding Zn ribbon-like protein